MSIAPSIDLNIFVINTFDNGRLVNLPDTVEFFPDRDTMLASIRRRVTQSKVAGGRCTVSHSDKNDQWYDITALVAQ